MDVLCCLRQVVQDDVEVSCLDGQAIHHLAEKLRQNKLVDDGVMCGGLALDLLPVLTSSAAYSESVP